MIQKIIVKARRKEIEIKENGEINRIVGCIGRTKRSLLTLLVKILEDELVGLGYEDHDDTMIALWFIECGISKYKEIQMNLEIIEDPTM